MSNKADKSVQTGAQLVVRALEAQGVTHIVGVPGGKIVEVFDGWSIQKSRQPDHGTCDGQYGGRSGSGARGLGRHA
jgi:Thiamine pyrophosphate enzyme, N-terminal TPP binding domain